MHHNNGFLPQCVTSSYFTTDITTVINIKGCYTKLWWDPSHFMWYPKPWLSVYCLNVVTQRPGSCFCIEHISEATFGNCFQNQKKISFYMFFFPFLPFLSHHLLPNLHSLSSIAFLSVSTADPSYTGAVLIWSQQELFIFTCVYTEPPAIHHLWLSTPIPTLAPMQESLALWFLLQ